MENPRRSLLLTLLPLVGCPPSTEETATPTDTDTTAVSERGCYSTGSTAGTCPDAADVPIDQVIPETCGATVVSVDGAGTVETCPWIGGFAPDGWCTYPITVLPPETACDYGRPLVVGGAPRMAALVAREGWSIAAEPAQDPVLAAAWARVGLAEHASIASFARFVLELLALGAPAELVAAAQEAAGDEVRHAKLAFGLASAYTGRPLGPGPLALGDLAVEGDLVRLAVATAREGCIAETLSALQMADARDRAEPPARAVLATLARDESRHAALAWRTVRWAIDTGGTRVRDAVAEVFRSRPAFPADGPLTSAEAARLGWEEVILPAAAALLGTGQERHAAG